MTHKTIAQRRQPAAVARKPAAPRPPASPGALPVRIQSPEADVRRLRDAIIAVSRILGDELLSHPENPNLRAALASPPDSGRIFFRNILRLTFRVLILMLLERRGLAQAPCLAKPLPTSRRSAANSWSAIQRLFKKIVQAKSGPFAPLAALTPFLWSASPDDLAASTRIGDRPLAKAIEILRAGLGGGDPVAPEAFGSAFESLLDLEPSIHLENDRGTLTLNANSASLRKSTGAYYTPDDVVHHMIRTTLDPALDQAIAHAPADPRAAILSVTVCDPACGSGRFLLAASRRIADKLKRQAPLRDQRHATADAITHCVHGVDLNPVAVELCKLALWLEAESPDLPLAQALTRNIRRGDALLGASPLPYLPNAIASTGAPSRESLDAWCAKQTPRSKPDTSTLFHWPLEFPAIFEPSLANPGFAVILGNPPFLNQLESVTAASRPSAALLGALSNNLIRGYTDLSAAFLWRAITLTRREGRVSLVLPQSLLAVKDAAPLRRWTLAHASLECLWVSNTRVFTDASVLTCVPSFLASGPRRLSFTPRIGADFTALPPRALDMDDLAHAETWAHLAAAGVPDITIPPGPTLAAIAHATADFRDQFYGLDGFLVDDASLTPDARNDAMFPPIVTTGLIDLADCRWGGASTRILKRVWSAPRVDRARMASAGALASWISARLTPKILLATQTRVIELIADPAGRFLPCTPLITITPKDPRDLWRIAAAAAAPVCSALAMRQYAGAALSPDAIKLSAKQVLRLPLPTRKPAWNDAARVLKRASEAATPEARHDLLLRFGAASCASHDLSPSQTAELMAWWAARLTPRPRNHRSQKEHDRPLGRS